MRRRGMTLVELLVVISIIAILLAILLPAVHSTRGAARLITCKNNFRQCSLAVLGYTAASDDRLPPMLSPRIGDVGTSLGWRIPILPFIEGGSLYRAFKQDEPMFSDVNRPIIASVEPVFQCPSTPSFPRSHSFSLDIDGFTDDLSVGARDNQVLFAVGVPDRSRLAGGWYTGKAEALKTTHQMWERATKGAKLQKITDGLSKTAMLIEQSGMPIKYGLRFGSESGEGLAWSGDQWRFGWPFNTGPEGFIDLDRVPPINDYNSNGIYTFHTDVLVLSHFDGSVVSLSHQTDVLVLANRLARSDGN